MGDPQKRPDPANRQRNGQFGAGNRANPGGRPPGVRACMAAVDAKRDPNKVTAALDEFYRRHMEDGDNEAGKVWLAYQIGKDGGDMAFVEEIERALEGVSDQAMSELRTHLQLVR